MDVDAALRVDLNGRRERVSKYEHIYKRLLKYQGVIGLTILINDRIFQSTIPKEKAEPIAEKWMTVYHRVDRDIRNMDPEDRIISMQVSTKNHELIIAFGEYLDNSKKRFAIMVHQLTDESVLPEVVKDKKDCKLDKRKDKPGDPREVMDDFKWILELRKKIWEDQPEMLLPKNDPQFWPENWETEMEHLKQLQDTPQFRGHRREGKDLEIFYHYLSRCKISPPDPKTGKCKWTWVGKPLVEDFGIANELTLGMAKEFTETHEEVEKAIDELNGIIEDKTILDDDQREKLKKKIKKQKIKILMRKLEELRMKRLDRRWRQRCLKMI